MPAPGTADLTEDLKANFVVDRRTTNPPTIERQRDPENCQL
jgi:hypothetical protein